MCGIVFVSFVVGFEDLLLVLVLGDLLIIEGGLDDFWVEFVGKKSKGIKFWVLFIL